MIRVIAPSNIALVKYMGKEDHARNLPANPSLSLTLSGLATEVELTACAAPGLELVEIPEMSREGRAKIEEHFARVRACAPQILKNFGLASREPQGLRLKSKNHFPTAAGIASSASSFAAMTTAFTAACSADPARFAEAFAQNLELKRALASLSREGSGSSCRSFEGPWVVWEGELAGAMQCQTPEMTDFVLLVSQAPKKVGSSEAHRRVQTSPLFTGRPARARERVRALEAALAEGDLSATARIAWAEMWEMHSLFHTCSEPFTYWEPGTVRALNALAPLRDTPEAPIVTMDAGANVHVLVPTARAGTFRSWLDQNLAGIERLEDHQGTGVTLALL